MADSLLAVVGIVHLQLQSYRHTNRLHIDFAHARTSSHPSSCDVGVRGHLLLLRRRPSRSKYRVIHHQLRGREKHLQHRQPVLLLDLSRRLVGHLADQELQAAGCSHSPHVAGRGMESERLIGVGKVVDIVGFERTEVGQSENPKLRNLVEAHSLGWEVRHSSVLVDIAEHSGADIVDHRKAAVAGCIEVGLDGRRRSNLGLTSYLCVEV